MMNQVLRRTVRFSISKTTGVSTSLSTSNSKSRAFANAAASLPSPSSDNDTTPNPDPILKVDNQVVQYPTTNNNNNKNKKKSNRIPKHERETIVVSYVLKYREAHDGKFPSVTATCSHVGGSYYTIRKIIQALQHQAAASPAEFGKRLPIVNPSKAVKKGRAVAVSAGHEETGSLSDEHLQLTEQLGTADDTVRGHEARVDEVRSEFSKHAHTPNVLAEGDSKDVLHPFTEKLEDIKENSQGGVFDVNDIPVEKRETHDLHLEVSDDSEMKNIFVETEMLVQESEVKNVAEFDKLEEEQKERYESPHLSQHKESTVHDKHEKDTSVVEYNDDDVSRKSTLWGNLKSFAGGIIRLWRKR